jgi:hypothetical protein
MKVRVKTLTFGTLAAALVALVTGCLPFPLGDPAKSQVDPKLAGYWMNTGDDEREIVALYPFDEHTYLVEDVKAKKEDNKWQPQGPPSVYKGWLTTINNVRFITLEPLQQRLPGASADKAYPTMRLTVDGNAIIARPVNGDAEQIKAVKNAAELQAVITKELNNPDIYSGEGTKFTRLDPDVDSENVQMIFKQ